MSISIITLVLAFMFASAVLAVAEVPNDIWNEYVYWTKLVKKSPNSAYNNFNLAIVMAYMGKVEEGAELLNKVARLDPNAVPRYLLFYEKKVAQYPNNWRYRFRLAFVYYFADKLYAAIDQFEWVANSSPVNAKNAWAMGYIAVIKAKQGKWNRAEEYCRRALEIEPDGAALHAALAEAYYNQKKVVEASAEMVTAMRLKKDFEKYEARRWGKTR